MRKASTSAAAAEIDGQFAVRTNWKAVWLISAAAWLVIAAVESATSYSYRIAVHSPLPFWRMFKDVSAHNVLGALVTPGIYKLALSFPINSKRIAAPLAIHLVASVVLAVLNAAWHFALTPLHLSPSWREPLTLSLFLGFSSYAWFIDTSSTYIPVLAIAYMVSYYQRFREGEVQKLILDAQLAKAQLAFLRSQLNPHFLFNALHSVGSLMHFDIDAADKMMSKLSDLLRMALEQSDSDEIELGDELVFVDKYLEIEKVRLGPRLWINRQIDEETLHVHVPPLILQPLVENAVIHGVAQRAGGGELCIETSKHGDYLRIVVRNEGTLRAPLFRAPCHEGVGLRNIRERLAQIFGNNHRLELAEDAAGVVNVTIEIPWNPSPTEIRTEAQHLESVDVYPTYPN